MIKQSYPNGSDSARVIAVIEVKTARGSGASPDDPVRTITEYWSLFGEKLAESDPIGREGDVQSDT